MANNDYILGINGGVRPGYQDVSAVLMQNGKVLAAIEEERLSRVKHSAGMLPVLSVQQVLKSAGININNVATVAFHGSTWQLEIEEVIRNHFISYFGHCPVIKRYHHHDCHAASAYYPSGFNEALVITVDGSGDGVSTQVAVGRNGKLEVIERYNRPQSLGIFYSLITQLCGFTRDADEYKLMGLAAYGKPIYNLHNFLNVGHNNYNVDEGYMVKILPGQPSPSRYEMAFSTKLTDELQLPRRHTKEITQNYKNLAASAQEQLELALTTLVKHYVKQTGITKVCMAGGVALNCLANQKIEAIPEVEELFIQPASSDAGISMGAAMLASVETGAGNFQAQTHTFFGNSFQQTEIEETLSKCNIPFSIISEPIKSAATALAQGKVIGWFQGQMEFGPRALGNRSILANPATPNVQQTVNQKIKFREGFRPFGASVLEEDFNEHFDARCKNAPYMTKVFNVRPKYQNLLKGVTHFDGTCRVQTVNVEQNSVYYHLLHSFKELTGFGVLLNTSFNLSHEPIVNTPREAIASFYASGMDELYIGNCLITK